MPTPRKVRPSTYCGSTFFSRSNRLCLKAASGGMCICAVGSKGPILRSEVILSKYRTVGYFCRARGKRLFIYSSANITLVSGKNEYRDVGAGGFGDSVSGVLVSCRNGL